MPLSENMKVDFTFKKIKGRRFTALEKSWYEEFPGSMIFLHADEVWADNIPVPAPGTSTSVVEYYSDLKLTEDNSVPDKKAWLACETPGDLSTQLKEFIPPRFHQSYTVRLYEDNGAGGIGNEIPTTHPSNWVFDYENGVLKFENDPTSYGLTAPFHIQVYRYIGQKVSSSLGGVSKLRAFLREASSVSVSAGMDSVDVTSVMTGKSPGGSETQEGIVTSPPYNRCPILSYPDRDEILTPDGNRVYGRLSFIPDDGSGVGDVWMLSFYYIDESGNEQLYTFETSMDIIWGYYEVLDFPNWPVFDDDAVLPSDQVVGDIPEATTSQYGKVVLAEDNEVTENEVVRADDPRAKKTVDFALKSISGDGTNITVVIGSGVWNVNGDKTTETTLTISQTADTYYLVYVNLLSGIVDITSSSSVPEVPQNCQALYRFTTDSSGNINVVDDVRPVYAMGIGGGDGLLGIPPDGTYEDGLLDFTNTTPINDAVDQINEVLKYLAPEDAQPLSGNIVWSTAMTTGYIADGVTLSYLTAGTSATIFRDTTLNGSTPNQTTMFNKADFGILRLYVNDVEADSFNLGSAFNEAERSGCQSYTPATSPGNMITVTSVCWYNNFPLWQKGNADISITGLTAGDIKVKLSHDVNGDGSILNETNEFIGFCDPETGRPVASNVTKNALTVNNKFLSGINFIGKDSVINVSGEIDKAFEYTYVTSPAVITFPGAPDTDVTYNDTSVSGVSDPPVYNETMTITNKSITLSIDNVESDDAKATIIPRDPWGNGTSATDADTNKWLINTWGSYPANGTGMLSEVFQCEHHRLPSTWDFEDKTTPNVGLYAKWDSQQLLNNGDAQVFNGKLIYPQTDYTSGYYPPQTANYSTFSGPQSYYRFFAQDAVPHSNGKIRIGNITWNDIETGKVKIEIKLPTQTGWLDLSQPFNAATFTGADGDGAMVSYSEAGGYLDINWSCGTFSTANSGYRYYIKVTLNDPSIEITYLGEAGW